MNIDNLMEANNMEESLKTADKQCPRIVNVSIGEHVLIAFVTNVELIALFTGGWS